MSNLYRSNHDSSRRGSAQGWGRPNNPPNHHESRTYQHQPFSRGCPGGRQPHRGGGRQSHKGHGQQQRSIPRNNDGYYGPQQQFFSQRYTNNNIEGESATAAMSSNPSSSDRCRVSSGDPPQLRSNATEKIADIPRKIDFSEMTDEELHNEFKEQIQDLGIRWEEIPQEIRNFVPADINRQKTKDAASVAITEVMAEQKAKRQDKIARAAEEGDDDGDVDMKNTEDDDGFDDDNSEESAYNLFHSKRTKYDPGFEFTEEEIISFFSNLRKNLVFDIGFRVKGLNEKHLENCWCPCGKKMLTWRKHFIIDHIVEKYNDTNCSYKKGKSKERITPIGLMSHLESKMKVCVLHLGVYKYLWELYGDLRGIGHKALYNMNDLRYKRAEALENQEKEELYLKALYELQEEKKRSHELEQENKRKEEELQKYMEDLKESDQQAYQGVAELESCLKALNINHDLSDFIGEKRNYTKEEEDTFDVLFDAMVKCLKFGIPEPEEEKDIVKLEVEQSLSAEKQTFDINAIMKAQYKPRNKKSETTIFEQNEGKQKFLFDWKINYKGLNIKDHWRKRRDDAAIDEGGPTRQIFSQFWENMAEIEVKFNGKSIKLFTMDERIGFCPTMDQNLEAFIESHSKLTHTATLKEVRKRKQEILALNQEIDLYYRAVGIFFFRAIVGRYPIAPKAMPRFLRNVLLRNCEPRNTKDYPSKQVLLDFKDFLGWELKREDVVGKTLQELHDEGWEIDIGSEVDKSLKITDENFITIFVQNVIVDRFSRAIRNIRRGLTLDGDADLTPLFSKTPIDLISCKFFAKEKVSAEDLFSAMKLTNGQVVTCDGEEEIVVESHREFFNGPVKETIFGWTNEMRSDFLFFCTGYKYLSNDSNFFIEVSFDLPNDHWPTAHSCVPQLRLPENAYCGDKFAFQEIIIKALQSHAGGLMSMN